MQPDHLITVTVSLRVCELWGELPQDGATHHSNICYVQFTAVCCMQSVLNQTNFMSNCSPKTCIQFLMKTQLCLYDKITHAAHLQSSSFGRETRGTPGFHWTDSGRRMQRPYPEFYLRCSTIFWERWDRKHEKTLFKCTNIFSPSDVSALMKWVAVNE